LIECGIAGSLIASFIATGSPVLSHRMLTGH
jgi:hypothetical protein